MVFNMDFSSISLFNIMKSKLEYLSERQSVLAQNIANADTPGYIAKDIPEPDFKRMMKDSSKGAVQKLQMAATDSRHIPSREVSSSFAAVKNKKTAELNPNGNNVVIEEEMSKVAMNQAEYQKVLNLYGKAVSMFKTAIGNPNTSS